MPYDTKVHLIHDQTEETDGDRSKQREGWPSNKEGEDPKPKWKKLNKENEINMKEVASDIKSDIINVFVTYAWEDNEHNDKVISFVNFVATLTSRGNISE